MMPGGQLGQSAAHAVPRHEKRFRQLLQVRFQGVPNLAERLHEAPVGNRSWCDSFGSDIDVQKPVPQSRGTSEDQYGKGMGGGMYRAQQRALRFLPAQKQRFPQSHSRQYRAAGRSADLHAGLAAIAAVDEARYFTEPEGVAEMEALGIRPEGRQRVHGEVVRGVSRPRQALPTAVDFKAF
jgi:hypothetical protein